MHGDQMPRRPTRARQRWTLAAAVADEDMSDDVLVEELERLRRDIVPGSAFHTSTDRPKMSEDNLDVYSGPQEGLQNLRRGIPRKSHSVPFPSPPLPSTPDIATWHTARHALLTCRELVRTERHYLAEMRVLLGGTGTSTAPPKSMLAPILTLVHTSEELLGRMSGDPSAWGVSAAFLGGETELEEAFVGWCKVVGELFFGGDSDKPKLVRRRNTTGDDAAPRPRRKSMTSFATSGPRAFMRKRTSSATEENDGMRAKPAVRDLAILPTQRVTRYVLLYRGTCLHVS
jgi:hypothetical protein